MKPAPPAAAPASGALRHQSRALRWTVGVGLAAMTAIGLVLLFLLTQATNNRELYERNYAWLFGINVLVALLLLAVLLWVAVRLSMRLRQGRFGSRLLVKLAAIFALVGLVPGVEQVRSIFDIRRQGAAGALLCGGVLRCGELQQGGDVVGLIDRDEVDVEVSGDMHVRVLSVRPSRGARAGGGRWRR